MGNDKAKDKSQSQGKGKISTNQTAPPPTPNGVNDVVVNITREKLQLILLFWVKERDQGTIRYTGNSLFSETVQTRLNNIYNSSWYNKNKHKVHCPPIQAIHEIGTIVKNWITKYGGPDKVETLEIGVCSHSGLDGPISYQTAVNPPASKEWPHQMAITDGWDAIDFNWKPSGARCVFYGCKSGTDSVDGFAIRLSKLNNFKNVAVWGQTTYSYPSFYPDYRVTTYARVASAPGSWSVGPTYMIAANRQEALKALQGQDGGVLELTPEQLKSYPAANPMKSYKSGTTIQTTHQGVFNDHRKNKS
ncbi:hypothetical protein MTZ49_11000 [Entomomonas sp. E2T0]|uniref:hypothetical protein n=1 Tax=Entomomonas sp. E2T0 TaxID=2930213 RepID=UPI0022281527|nr:hypothetical protein [Entomomonas sp. E2T0]UYZ83125.1 hypothetical protein MTZ49_11000 [Entomomonas sp. E2T0]